jgi:anti-anti-sigma regulatory factor
VKLITSEGAACIAFCFPTVQSVGGQMRVAGASGWVRKEFAVTRLDTIIPFDPSVAAAQQALKA